MAACSNRLKSTNRIIYEHHTCVKRMFNTANAYTVNELDYTIQG